VDNGGIVGRGILLDYVRWRAETGQKPAKVDARTGITVDELDKVAAFQNLTFKTGDILIIRTGFTVWHDSTPSGERNAALDKGDFIGVEADMKSVRWLWNHHFAAVTCDTMSFEVSPVPLGKAVVTLHEWLLTRWGTPIGELWDLEKLSSACAEAKKWSFFLTSAPLNVYGGVGTTCNAIAVL
jgi:kynurenine formamidase